MPIDDPIDLPESPMIEHKPAARPSARRPMPATRESVTHKFMVGGHEGYLTIGLYPDGSPGELFLKISKEGSAISGFCKAFCLGFSLAIQHGVSVGDAVRRFRGMRFEPSGATSNPEIPEADSIVDYIARYIELNFVDHPGDPRPRTGRVRPARPEAPGRGSA